MMLLAILWWILKIYCVVSYIACAYVLWVHRHDVRNIESTPGDKIVASAIFFIFAPIVLGDVLLEKLAGPGPRGVG
jgi:hypothetical protein